MDGGQHHRRGRAGGARRLHWIEARARNVAVVAQRRAQHTEAVRFNARRRGRRVVKAGVVVEGGGELGPLLTERLGSKRGRRRRDGGGGGGGGAPSHMVGVYKL